MTSVGVLGETTYTSFQLPHLEPNRTKRTRGVVAQLVQELVHLKGASYKPCPIAQLELNRTCRVVAQLVQELMHLKGGGQRLDEARGLDGAWGEGGGGRVDGIG